MNRIWLYRAFKSEDGRMKEFSAKFDKTAKQEYPGFVGTYETYYKYGAVDPREARWKVEISQKNRSCSNNKE